MLASSPLVHHPALQRLELLLLLRGEHLADLLYGRDMRQMEVRLFGGDGEKLLLHFGQIGVRSGYVRFFPKRIYL